MSKKSKVIAAGLSLLLASFAGAASAGESSFYHYDFSSDTENGCGHAYMIGYLGAAGNFEQIYYDIPDLADGDSLSVMGTDSLLNSRAWGQFSCVQGMIYYSGEDYLDYDWGY